MEKKFKIGDVVCLNSGGPNMTVERYSKLEKLNSKETEETSKVECRYFDDKGELKVSVFEQGVLHLIEK
ncbi:hypothetical protein AGMMS49982_10110 [Bacteroidia bacterium]|nr:hypothetical protein AGMMS49982_10110 [Bacteroidia bacterium]